MHVVDCKGNDTPEYPQAFKNARTERYAILADSLDGTRGHARLIMLPMDDTLSEELQAHRRIYEQGDSMKWRVTPKEHAPDTHADIQTVKDAIGRSPDRADSVTYQQTAQAEVRGTLEGWLNVGAF